MANSSNEHYRAGLYFCRYLLNTCKYQIVYDRLSNESIITYSDSDWAQDPESCKSVIGYFTLIAHKVISWISYQQKTVAQLRLNIWLSLIIAVSLSEQETFLMKLALMLQLLIYIAIILVHFSGIEPYIRKALQTHWYLLSLHKRSNWEWTN